MSDQAHRWTDERLAELEQRIHRVYGAAAKELRDELDAYFETLERRDNEMRAMLERGSITEQKVIAWRQAQIGRGKRVEALMDDLAQRMTQSDQLAMSYVRAGQPDVYAVNRNWVAYTIEQVHGNVGFTLYDERTVRRLLAEDPELFPQPAVDIPVDERWNRTKLQDALTAGILKGESLSKIAWRMQCVAEMNDTAAIRSARTAFTGAQNAGRQASMACAARMGIDVYKGWVATKDMRTRHSHGAADGQVVPYNEPFSVGGARMMYPGDPSGPPQEVYNCRCTMRTVEKPGIEAEPRQMRVRDPVTGENVLVKGMTYPEWMRWKADLQQQAGAGIIKAKLEAGEITTRLSVQQYDKHVQGTKQYEQYLAERLAKGNTPQSLLLISRQDAQEILKERAGTGQIKVTRTGEYRTVEYYSLNRVAGQVFENGRYVDTTRVAAHYGKKGAHLVPVKEVDGE